MARQWLTAAVNSQQEQRERWLRAQLRRWQRLGLGAHAAGAGGSGGSDDPGLRYGRENMK